MKHLIYVLIILIINIIFKFLKIEFFSDLEIKTISRFILVVITFTYIFVNFKLDKNYFLKNTLLYSIVSVTLLSLSFNTFISDYNTYELSMFIGFTFLTGTFEEFLFRIIVFFSIWNLFQNKSFLIKVLISSLIFGLSHLSNLFNEDIVKVTVISQVIFAFIVGIFLFAILFKTKNILVPILVHCLINFFGSINTLNDSLPISNYSIKSLFSTLFFIGILSLVLIPISLIAIKSETKYWESLKFEL